MNIKHIGIILGLSSLWLTIGIGVLSINLWLYGYTYGIKFFEPFIIIFWPMALLGPIIYFAHWVAGVGF